MNEPSAKAAPTNAAADSVAERSARLQALVDALAGRIRPAARILPASAAGAGPDLVGLARKHPAVVVAGAAALGGVLFALSRRGRRGEGGGSLLGTFVASAGTALGRELGRQLGERLGGRRGSKP